LNTTYVNVWLRLMDFGLKFKYFYQKNTMRYSLFFLLFLIYQFGFSQFENPKKSIRIGAVKDAKATVKKVDIDTAQASIKYESTIGKDKDEKLLKSISLAPKIGIKTPVAEEPLHNPSEIYTEKIQKEMKKEGITKEILNTDMFLGEFVVYTSELTTVCRDYGAIDGDNVRIWLNGELVVRNIGLQLDFQKYKLTLKDGLNIIHIEALNTGEFFPNTGQFMFFDGNQNMVTNQNWGLNTGYKAIVKVRKAKGLVDDNKKEENK
jgi:hypothetical protein